MAEYIIGMRVYNHDLSFYTPRRRIDFLVDNKKITKDDILFLIEEDIHEDYKKWFAQMGYETINMRGVTSITSKIHFDNYIQYNIFSRNQAIKNRIYKMRGVNTWYFAHAGNTADLFTQDNSIPRVDSYVKELYTSNFAVWNQRMKDFYQRQSPKGVKNYHIIGCPWSEHVEDVWRSGENKTLERAKKKWDASGFKPSKIITVFDTTVRAGFELGSIEFGFEFLNHIKNDIMREDVGIMFKVKNCTSKSILKYPLSYEMLPKELDDLYMKFADHRQCYMEYDLESATEEFIAAADYVYAAPFSSTVLEAGGAGVPAGWYTPPKYSTTYYTQATDREICPFEDGKGITRFRNLILNT